MACGPLFSSALGILWVLPRCIPDFFFGWRNWLGKIILKSGTWFLPVFYGLYGEK
jgi:hypothetical protein